MKYIVSRIRSAFPPHLRKRLPKEVRVFNVEPRRSWMLNKIYRGQSTPTNVLSFRYSREYGEILLCLPVIRKEARASGNSIEYQTAWMIIHAMIHLAGVHHDESRQSEARARTIEKKMLRVWTSSKSSQRNKI